MKREELICPSTRLERDMEVLCYTAESGAKGIAVLVIPPEGGPCKKYEQGGMIDAIKDYIEEGKIQVFVTDTTDWESWFNTTLDTHDRGLRQEAFYHYVVDELVPWIHKENGSDRPRSFVFIRQSRPASWRSSLPACPASRRGRRPSR